MPIPEPPALLTDPKTIRLFALGMALALGGLCVGGWQFYVKPQRATAEIRYRAHRGLMKLFDLQTAYKLAHGSFANDLDSLLASTPDGVQVREQLKASVDINTVAVIGDAETFRLEINVLDGKRTPVKIRGPGVGPKPVIATRPKKPPVGPSTKRFIMLSLGLVVAGLGVGAWQFLKPKRA